MNAFATRTRLLLPRTPHRAGQILSSSLRHKSSSSKSDFSRPGPPPLDRAAQREFEELQRRVNAPASAPQQGASRADAAQPATEEQLTMHPDMRKMPKPTFEGETNPLTGEVGGPKREPLAHGDWSYGGRATDF